MKFKFSKSWISSQESEIVEAPNEDKALEIIDEKELWSEVKTMEHQVSTEVIED